jgi:hypothetical protein
MLPGLYMGFNHHGFVFTVNTISTGKISANRTRETIRSKIFREIFTTPGCT